MPVPNLKSLVARIRKQYPETMTKAQVGEALYRIALEAQAMGHDIGVLLKRSGHRVPSPIGDISSDILVDIPDRQEYDVFTNADGEPGKPQAGPVWNKLKSKVGGAHSGAKMKDVRRPVGAVPQPKPEPKPKPEPPQPKPEPEPDVRDVIAGLSAKLDAQHNAVMHRLADLQADHRKPRKVTGSAGWLGRIDGEIAGVE